MSDNSQIALYRKYRPEKFGDVTGQEHIVEVLKRAVKNSKTAHAYLFAGTRGTGKTTVARILAQELKTDAKDVYEMDAASSRKIDDFRELNDSVHTLPFSSPFKVYIIDEVHMLTKEAFNAFLKTLEEPPKHVIFILATTEIDKLPDTIVSRCETHIFRTPSRITVADVVESVAKKEKVKMERGAAELIATLADGSFRDALGVLQKVISYSGDKTITQKEVEAVTGAPRSELVDAVVQGIATKDAHMALEAVQSAVAASTDIQVLMKLLLERVRTVLLLRVAPDMKDSLREQFSSEDFKKLSDLAKESDSAVTSKVLAALLKAYVETPRSYIPQLPLELALSDALKE